MSRINDDVLLQMLKLTSSHISVTWCLQSKKTTKLPFKMTSCRNPLTAATLLILMMRVFRGNTLPCHPTKYLIGNECCPMCPAGSRVEADCTEFRSTSCLPCIDGTFMNQPTRFKQCFPCTKCSPGPGVRIKSSCTTTSDTVCEPLEGHYCIDPEGSSCLAAKKHTPCRSGQYISEKGTALTDTVCSDCSEGTFSDGTFTSCRPHTQCGSGSHLIKPGTAESDAECEEEEKSSNVTVIVGSSAAVLLFLVGVYLVFRKKKSCPPGSRDSGNSPEERKTPGGSESQRKPMLPQQPGKGENGNTQAEVNGLMDPPEAQAAVSNR